MKRKRGIALQFAKKKALGNRNLQKRIRMQKVRSKQIINRRIWFFENGHNYDNDQLPR